ncbi:hypothetical protein SH1V18_19720 [Vallitalea longa]|uniref:CN hydrolase domain-containing protein n=1 Tax=Vallitalea longa TaxID=2936439 RepID=A0A9W6DFH8_9FIRM|nr:hypothetical protein [Vallitalea longa]GKX29492.1 hypothetical protein SH1V18_19720 [Vallitalea longa]
MKILISQAYRSEDIKLLKSQIENHDFDILVFPEGYIANEKLLYDACILARKYGKPILSSYLDSVTEKDHAVVIDENGDKVLLRKKSLIEGPLLKPSITNVLGLKVGYMLCCEIFLDNIDFSGVEAIFNPIGVGMFSEEQYTEWTCRAQGLAKKYNCYVIGTSHADGSYRNCGISIPIAYVYGTNGEEIYLSKSDVRSVIVDLDLHEVQYITT